MKVLIVWSGAVVPAYRPFFRELARRMRVRVLSPRGWRHGSRDFGPVGDWAESGCEIVATPYFAGGGARYLVPALPWHLWTYRPRYLYVMDEMDRASLAWHALLARLCWPPVRVVNYSLQNLRAPRYYRWHHRLATLLNQILVSRSIAASEEADAALKANGYSGPTRVIPLWASESWFRPADPADRPGLRRVFGIRDEEIALIFAGSMAEAKGLRLLAEVLPRFPRLRVLSAGQGPLAAELPWRLGSRWRHLGSLGAEELRSLYQAGDYVILPSLTLPDWKEQIGRSLIEGVLCGCIALGSDSGNIPGITLFPEATFRQGDAESLAVLLSALPIPGADGVRAAQRRNVEERYTAAAVARATGDFLLDARPGKAAGTGAAA
ncbi:MAG: glycosyltransferase family 4 protein [Fibrobacteres bacterium]|nr:glycosyltransferase family 4 protein [Fibrobacterota bacterium]